MNIRDLKSKFASWLMRDAINQEVDLQVKKFFDSRNQDRQSFREHEAQSRLGKLWIVVSNEIEDIRVCYGKEFMFITMDNTPAVVFHDVVTGEDLICGGAILAYNEQRYLALVGMDPNARISLFFNREEHKPTDKTKTQARPTTPVSEQIEKTRLAVEKFIKV
jgi:hypothetical protein